MRIHFRPVGMGEEGAGRFEASFPIPSRGFCRCKKEIQESSVGQTTKSALKASVVLNYLIHLWTALSPMAGHKREPIRLGLIRFLGAVNGRPHTIRHCCRRGLVIDSRCGAEKLHLLPVIIVSIGIKCDFITLRISLKPENVFVFKMLDHFCEPNGKTASHELITETRQKPKKSSQSH
jgi:hypothetical protein